MKYENKDMKRQIMYLKKSLLQFVFANLKIFDKYGNEISRTETVNEVDKEIIIK